MEKQREILYLSAHIANYFLWRAKEDCVNDMTPLKLIKLVYFAYAWYYAVHDRRLFNEKIEAWRYGPVVPSIYHEFKQFKDRAIDKYAIDYCVSENKISVPMIDDDDTNTMVILDSVWKIYKNKTGTELSNTTHRKGGAWKSAYEEGKNKQISDSEIVESAKEAIFKYKDLL